jgi:hypothetical protein
LEDHDLKFTWAKAGKTKYLKNKIKKSKKGSSGKRFS